MKGKKDQVQIIFDDLMDDKTFARKVSEKLRRQFELGETNYYGIFHHIFSSLMMEIMSSAQLLGERMSISKIESMGKKILEILSSESTGFFIEKSQFDELLIRCVYAHYYDLDDVEEWFERKKVTA